MPPLEPQGPFPSNTEILDDPGESRLDRPHLFVTQAALHGPAEMSHDLMATRLERPAEVGQVDADRAAIALAAVARYEPVPFHRPQEAPEARRRQPRPHHEVPNDDVILVEEREQ